MRKRQPGFEEERKRQRIQNFAAFLRLSPDLFRVEAGKVTARKQRTLATHQEPKQPLRRLRRVRDAPNQMSLDAFR